MSSTADATSTRTGTGGPRDRTVGTLTVLAGALFVVGVLASTVVEWTWLAVLAGLALLVYVVPRLHRVQSPADGWAGRAGSLLVLAGAGLIVALAVVFVIWDAVGDPGEPAWADAVWLVGFFAFVVGIVAFAVGSIQARRFPPAAPVLMLVGLVAAVAIDMLTGAFFSDDEDTIAWGALLGIPLFGLGLAWMGLALRRAVPAGDRPVRQPAG